MSELTASSELDIRLAKVQALIEQGKQRRALQELWNAEAHARGNADAIREMLDFTTAFEQRVEPRQKSRLTDLVATLEHDAEQASRSPIAAPLVSDSAPTQRSDA